MLILCTNGFTFLYTKMSKLILSFSEPSGFPRNLRVVSILSSSIRFQWDALECEKHNGPLLGYEYHFDSGNETVTAIVGPNSTTCIITLLQPGRIVFSVAAVNDAGVGYHCPPVSAVVRKFASPVTLHCQTTGSCIYMYIHVCRYGVDLHIFNQCVLVCILG